MFMCLQCSRGPEEGVDPLSQELQMVVAVIWVLETESRSSGRVASTLNHDPPLQSQNFMFYFFGVAK